jgi:phasin family protein
MQAGDHKAAACTGCLGRVVSRRDWMIGAEISAQPARNNPMSQQFANRSFDQAKKFMSDGNVQAIAEKGLKASKDVYDKIAAVATDRAKVITDITDAAWANTKMVHDRIMQNATQNIDIAFAAARGIAAAKSLPEIAKHQSEFFNALSAQAVEQTRELADLSARATQQVFEKVQVAATKSFKSVL